MAEDFGASFGDPSRYMGKSKIAEMGKEFKDIYIAKKLINDTGLRDFLNQSSASPQAPGALPPVRDAMAPMVPPAAPAVGVSPMQPQAPTIQQTTPPAADLAPQPSIGSQILNGTFQGDPLPEPKEISINFGQNAPVPDPDGMAFQQTPGYGKLQQFAQFMFG